MPPCRRDSRQSLQTTLHYELTSDPPSLLLIETPPFAGQVTAIVREKQAMQLVTITIDENENVFSKVRLVLFSKFVPSSFLHPLP